MVKKFFSNIPELSLMVITTAVVLILFAEVVFRYFIGTSLDWIEEVSRMLLIWMVFIGAAVALKRNEHIAVHYFLSFFPKGMYYYIEVFTYGIIVFFSVFLCIQGTIFSVLSKDTTFPALQISVLWMYIGLPAGCFIMVIYGSRRLIATIKNHKAQE